MSEFVPKPFEIEVNGETYYMELGRCAIALMRKKQQVDYIALEVPSPEAEEEDIVRLFNCVEYVRWFAGYAICYDENGILERRTTFMEDTETGELKTFREVTGWNPTVVEKEEPFDWEEDRWLKVNTRDVEAPPEDWK